MADDSLRVAPSLERSLEPEREVYAMMVDVVSCCWFDEEEIMMCYGSSRHGCATTLYVYARHIGRREMWVAVKKRGKFKWKMQKESNRRKPVLRFF